MAVSVSTGVMKPLLGKLATLMGDEFSKLKNLRKEAKFISDELTSMKDVLESLAEVSDLDLQTKRWRDIVREMSFDIENIIDDFMRKIGDKIRKDGLVKKTIRRLKTSIARHQIADQIEAVKKLVCETSERRRRYKFDIPSSSDVTIDPRVATLYKDAATLVGVEGPTDELVTWLKDEDTHLKVVSIVGFGGLGETTLSNEVYRRLKEEFGCGAFVPASQKPNIPKLVRSLLSEVGSGLSLHDCEVNVLLNKLREYLYLLIKQGRDTKNSTKKFRKNAWATYLIIIDDLWDTPSWDIIKSAFPDNGLGSRVITTTRIQNVAKACCSPSSYYIFKMKPLSNKDSKRLFFGRIFNSEEACPHQLRDVSTEILKKCDGLPLAIITISGMLANESFDQEEWKHVRNSLGSGTNFTLEGMRNILDLRYKNLPPHLKTCLLYLGMYPEDFGIGRSHLELQWIAEGFVPKENGQDAEKVARSYFNELVNRSLIQPTKFNNQGSAVECKVHDMMLDLILSKCREENFLTVLDDAKVIEKLDYKVLRLSLHLDGPRDGTMLPCKVSMSQIRYPLPDGISRMKSLRCVSGFDLMLNSLDNIKDLGELTNLTAIKFSISSSLADSSERKSRLDALNSSLGRCISLKMLVLNIPGCNDALMALSPPPRRLEILYAYGFFFSRVPNWMGELSNLKELSITVLGSDIGILAELPGLTHFYLYIKEILKKRLSSMTGYSLF
uniref:Disease resistance protein RPP13 n=1 Tax=Aegilops tauschii TaxID=37682 RepID=M8C9J8_AEGTA